MNKILIGLSLLCSLFANSQQRETTQEKKNLIKMNLTSVVFRNYQFAYERLFTKRFSVQVSYGFIPAGQIPFVDEVIKDENVENIKLGGNNLTIEPRFYLGKGYGHGFYIAPYYRYSHFNVDNLTYRYTSEDSAFDGEKIPVSCTGKTNSNTI